MQKQKEEAGPSELGMTSFGVRTVTFAVWAELFGGNGSADGLKL
jgi:hypothetical protein